MEKHYVARSGRLIPTEVNASVLRDSAGRPAYRLAVVVNTAERQEAQEILGRQAERLRKQAELLDLAHDAILVRDIRTSVIVFWNEGAAAMYGWPKADALGFVSHVLLKAEFPERLSSIERQLRQQGHWQGELMHTCRGGRTLAVSSRWVVQRDARNEPSAILEMDTDVTERKRAQEELLSVTRHMRAVLEATAEGIYAIDGQGRCTFINKSAARLLGYEPREVLGKNVHELIHHYRPDGSPYPEAECPILRAYRQGRGIEQAADVFWRRDGTSFPVEFSSDPLCEGDSFTGVVVVFRALLRHKPAARAKGSSPQS
jgi:PAS domain S-box-containing protein